MSGEPTETPALNAKFVCEIPNCDKDYKNRSSMLSQMRTKHKHSEEIQSPFGNFPPANHESTQGNSRGEVNSPKVLSVMSFQCGVCNDHFDKMRKPFCT